MRAEADHRWAGRDSTGVLASLHGRPLDRARDEQERWHRWEAAFRGALGPEHPDTLAARANLARCTGLAGDPAAARDAYAALLPIRERVSGPEHPDRLTDRANLAACTGAAGDPAAARDAYAALLPIRERVLGPEHPDTLTARANLAYWTRQADVR